jgi:hypothetical protein
VGVGGWVKEWGESRKTKRSRKKIGRKWKRLLTECEGIRQQAGTVGMKQTKHNITRCTTRPVLGKREVMREPRQISSAESAKAGISSSRKVMLCLSRAACISCCHDHNQYHPGKCDI